MEQLEHANGLTSVLSGFLVVFALHLLLKLFNFALSLVTSLRANDNKKMDHLTKSMEENTKAIYALSTDLKNLNNRIVETDLIAAKQEVSHERLVATVRELAGDKWISIQEKIRKDEFIGEK